MSFFVWLYYNDDCDYYADYDFSYYYHFRFFQLLRAIATATITSPVWNFL